MAVREKSKAWTRKHDKPGTPFIRKAPILYPESLEDVIKICAERKPENFLRAAGSHWALSDAAVSDTIFVETHDPSKEFSAMGRTLFDVVPKCLSADFLSFLNQQPKTSFDNKSVNENAGCYLVHFETGKKVFQLYSELDLGDDNNPESLAVFMKQRFNNTNYFGPWAFHTLGGAGGQTVFGALTTGTHGGDFRFPGGSAIPPIADNVMALHLVADGGKHFWIERGNQPIQLTDDRKLRVLFEQDKFKGKAAKGQDNFEIIRDTDVFNAVLISAGRFGIVYSVVMKAVRQYCLEEERQLKVWQDIKGLVNNTSSSLYDNRFLQIAISVTPRTNFTENLCGVTKRKNIAPIQAGGVNNANPGDLQTPAGRKERRGKVLEQVNRMIQGPLFEKAGRTHSYVPDPDNPHEAMPASFLDVACENADFITGVLDATIEELESFIEDLVVFDGSAMDVVAVVGGTGLIALIAAFIAILAILKALRELFKDENTRFGQVMNTLREKLLEHSDPDMRAAGIFTWQMISNTIFSDMQGAQKFAAISYAVLDRHSYTDKSCEVNGDSIEVFFNATDSRLIAFVDALLAFEVGQEFNGRAFAGYISLRFTGKTSALLGMQQHDITCAVEVSGLKDVDGTVQLINFASTLARNNNFGGILHWGQRNAHTMAEIQNRFGDLPSAPGGKLGKWREALSRITGNGKLNGFSSAFTRFKGLEIVTPKITALSTDLTNVLPNTVFLIRWDASNNPPGTRLSMSIRHPDGRSSIIPTPALNGQAVRTEALRGTHGITLTATIDLNGQSLSASKSITIRII